MIKILSREQQMNADFLNSMTPLREVIQNTEMAAAVRFHDTVVEAVNCFGTCELFARHAERLNAMNLDPQPAKEAVARSRNFQEAGFESLDRARQALKRLKADFKKRNLRSKKGDCVQLANRSRTEFRRALCDLEIKAQDVVRIDAAVKGAFETGTAGNPEVLVEYLSKGINQLDEVRRRDDRGTRDNIPEWKWAAIFLIAGGVAVALVMCVLWPTTCPFWAPLFGSLISAIGGIIHSYC